MSKKTFMMNAVDNITAPVGNKAAKLASVKAVTVSLVGVNQYAAVVEFTDDTGSERQDVVWSVVPGATNKGTANINKQGFLDVSQAQTSDTFDVYATSVYFQANKRGSTVVSAPTIDGGRLGGPAPKSADEIDYSKSGTVKVTIPAAASTAPAGGTKTP